MSDKTGIQWCDSTWNPVVGCSLVSPGCTNCYAMKAANRLLDKPGSHYEGTTKRVNGNAVWTGKLNLAPEHILTQPLRWKRPRKIFVNSMSDLFHENIPDEWIDRIFAVMALAPQHTFQVLTKRPERMKKWFEGGHAVPRNFSVGNAALALDPSHTGKVGLALKHDKDAWPLRNVWLGVSVEDQKRADERIPLLVQTPAVIRFISAEPLLGPINLAQAGLEIDMGDLDSPVKINLHWCIVGGESGKDARPMHPTWARSLRDQCNAAGVAYLFKQWGQWSPEESIKPGMKADPGVMLFPGLDMCFRNVGKKAAGRLLDGRAWDEFPEAA